MSEILKWEMPKAIDNIVKSEIIKWENLPPTPVKHNIITSIDFSSIDQIQPSFIRAVDENNYYWMSQTEVTDFLYHASAYSVGLVERATLFGLDIILTTLT